MTAKESDLHKSSLRSYLSRNNLVLPSSTKAYIENISSRQMICLLCKEKLLDYEIYNCVNCFNIYHFKCFTTNIKTIKIAGFTRYTFDCECNFQQLYEIPPKYNCYCGKYYEAEKRGDPNFDPNLIMHGCGLMCNAMRCSHFRCQFPCHPGPHQICKERECQEDNVRNGVRSTSKIDGDILPSALDDYIINLKGQLKYVGASCEYASDIVYCGRANFIGGWKLKESIWANPFKVSDSETNEEACKKYEDYIRKKPELLDKLPHLVGKKLACWCYPQPCHTEVLIKLLKEKNLI